MVSGAKDGSIKIWQTTRPPAGDPLPGVVLPLGFSSDSGTLAALNDENDVVFINLATGEPVREFSLGHSRGRHPMIALSDDLRTLVQGRQDGDVTMWNTDTGETNLIHVANRPIDLLTLSPDGRHLLAGGRDQMPHWFDLRAGTNALWETEARSAVFSPDGRSVVSLQRDGTVEVWDVETQTLRHFLKSEQDRDGMLSYCFSPDGRFFVGGMADHSVVMWDTVTGVEVGTFKGHKQPVFALAFAPDGKTLVTSGADSTVRMWNVATRQELLLDRQLGGELRALVFSPDGQLLLGGGGFGSKGSRLRLYHAPKVVSAGLKGDIQ